MDPIGTKDLLEWLVVPLVGWLAYNVHTLSVRTAEILEQLKAGAATHQRHEEKITRIEERVEAHGEDIATLKARHG